MTPAEDLPPDEALAAARRAAAERPDDFDAQRELIEALHGHALRLAADGSVAAPDVVPLLTELLAALGRAEALHPWDAELAELAAEAQALLASALLQHDRFDEADDAARAAVTRARRLVAASPGETDPVTTLVFALETAAAAAQARDAPSTRRAALEEAMTLTRELRERDPDAADAHDFAEALEELADAREDDGAWDAAGDAWRDAVAARVAAGEDASEARGRLRAALDTLASRETSEERLDAALAARRAAVDLARELAASGDSEARDDLAYDLRELGELHVRREDHAAAAAAFEECVAIRRELLAQAPEDGDALNGLALALSLLRDAFEESGRRDAALPVAREAVDVGRRQAAQPDVDPEIVRDHGVDLDALGDLLRDGGDAAAARAAYAEAEGVFRRLLAADPASPRLREDLAIVLGRLAGLDRDAGDPPAAVARMLEAVALLRVLHAEDPQRVDAARLAVWLTDLADDHEAAGDAAAAARVRDEAAALASGRPDRPRGG